MRDDVMFWLLHPDFHALYFKYNGVRYIFSGWWLLDWSDGYDDPDKDKKFKIYDTKEEFIADPFFDGKTIEEINDIAEVVDVDLWP